jgi:hypothetical protein
MKRLHAFLATIVAIVASQAIRPQMTAGGQPPADGLRPAAVAPAAAGKVIRVTDFGVKPDGRADAVAGVRGLTIEGNGSEFVCHGRMQPLTLEECRGITVRNLSIDWDIPFVAQAKIEKVEKDHIDIRIDRRESPYAIEEGKIVFHGEGWRSRWWGCMEFDAQTRIIPQQSGDAPLGGNWGNYRGHVLVDGCKFEGLMDDPINVHGTSVRIIDVKDDRRVRCRFMEGMSTGMTWGRSGDRVGFIDARSMATVGLGAVKSYARIDRDQFEVEFDAEIPAAVRAGHALENLTWAPDFTVRNSTFGSCRARGLLISTPGKVVIENNDFVSSGAAILIAGDANGWYESGAVRDVLIRGNRFHPSCLTSWYQFGEGIISIFPIIPQVDPEKPFHRNIRIEGNRFDVFDYSVLYALSVDGLTFKDNTIEHNEQYKPWQGRKAMLTFEGCKRVVVGGNRLGDGVLGKNVRTLKMSPTEVNLAADQGLSLDNPDK